MYVGHSVPALRARLTEQSRSHSFIPEHHQHPYGQNKKTPRVHHTRYGHASLGCNEYQ
jgi:hypothetical protein